MIYGAMLAGGSGTRVKSSKIPKQFIEIGGKPIIIYTLENMLKVKRFDYIYIAVHKDYEDYMNEQVKKNIPESEKVRVILGGKERMDTINNVTTAITNDNGLHDDDVIVIHDAVRPFVTEKILNDSIDCAAEYGACVCGLPCADTILHSKGGEYVEASFTADKLQTASALPTLSKCRITSLRSRKKSSQALRRYAQ